MTTVNEIVRETITKFHQSQIPSNRAAYYITSEYGRLLEARAKAEADNRVWRGLLTRVLILRKQRFIVSL